MFQDSDDERQIEEVWNEYYPKLKRAIFRRVRNLRHPLADESEIALSAINSFVARVNDGRLDPGEEPNSLWKLLKTIAIRKVNDRGKHLRAQKRGGGKLTLQQSTANDAEDSPNNLLDLAADRNHPPDADEEAYDVFNQLFLRTADERVRDVILLRLQGASIAVIAEGLSLSTKTVRRMLERIEDEWVQAFLENEESDDCHPD